MKAEKLIEVLSHFKDQQVYFNEWDGCREIEVRITGDSGLYLIRGEPIKPVESEEQDD